MKYIFRKKWLIVLLSAVDAIGYALKPLFFRNPARIAPPKTILIVRLDHLGDVLLTSPMAEHLKSHYPNSKIVFLCSNAAKPLLEKNPSIDEIVVWDAPWFARGVSGKKSLRDLIRELKLLSIDCAFSVRGDAREHYLLKKAGIPRRIGYGITGLGFFLTQELPYESGAHESAHHQKLLRTLDVSAPTWQPKIYLTEEEELTLNEKMKKCLLRAGLPSSVSKIGIQIQSGASSKNWPIEHYRLFIQKLLEKEPSCAIFLLGAEKNAETFGDVLASKRVFDWRGQLSLRELGAFLKQCDQCVGPDSGPMHLAAALGKKTIFLFSGTNEFERWRPLEPKAVVLRHKVNCSPCFLNKCPIAGHPCMQKIEVRKVIDALQS